MSKFQKTVEQNKNASISITDSETEEESSDSDGFEDPSNPFCLLKKSKKSENHAKAENAKKLEKLENPQEDSDQNFPLISVINQDDDTGFSGDIRLIAIHQKCLNLQLNLFQVDHTSEINDKSSLSRDTWDMYSKIHKSELEICELTNFQLPLISEINFELRVLKEDLKENTLETNNHPENTNLLNNKTSFSERMRRTRMGIKHGEESYSAFKNVGPMASIWSFLSEIFGQKIDFFIIFDFLASISLKTLKNDQISAPATNF